MRGSPPPDRSHHEAIGTRRRSPVTISDLVVKTGISTRSRPTTAGMHADTSLKSHARPIRPRDRGGIRGQPPLGRRGPRAVQILLLCCRIVHCNTHRLLACSQDDRRQPARFTLLSASGDGARPRRTKHPPEALPPVSLGSAPCVLPSIIYDRISSPGSTSRLFWVTVFDETETSRRGRAVPARKLYDR